MADDQDSKFCPRCKLVLSVSSFTKNARTRSGLECWCIECRRAKARLYSEKNKEKIYANQKAWIAENKEYVREQRRAQYQANKERERELIKAWREANPDKVKEMERRNSRKRGPEKTALAKAKRNANPEAHRAKQAAYYEANSEKVKALAHAYRARKRGADGSYTPEDIKRIAKMQKNRCAYCKKDITSCRVIDHINPLSKGGTNYPNNLQLVCLPCNSSKRDKDAITFSRQLGRLI